MKPRDTLIAVAGGMLSLLAACQGGPEGLAVTPPGEGPQVRFDLYHQPLPEIPFPNDIATRADPRARTGRRINASQVAPTWLESTVRAKIDQLDGFGVLQPISVSFSAPLDIADLLRRHRDNLDFSDDAVYLFAIDPRAPGFAEPVLLDLGRGNFPLTLKSTDVYFTADARAGAGNALFDTVEEDVNGNGILDPGEDSDSDGVLDHPNVWPPGARPEDGLMTFYESETNTLLLRPVVPLAEHTTYAVLLTDRLRGRNGQPVRSPFPYVNHLGQNQALEPLDEVLARHPEWGIDRGRVAFAWTFTTQSITADLVTIREGLYGIGPLKRLAEEFPPEAEPDQMQNPEHADSHPPYSILPAERLIDVLASIGPALLGDMFEMVDPALKSFDYVDYFVSGSFTSPDFMRTSPDGLDPLNLHRENFSLDSCSGQAEYDSQRLYFLAAVPRPSAAHQPPFPVVVYCHSYSSLRAEALGFAGFMARHGFATIGIDAWDHGMPLDQGLRDVIESAARGWGFEPFAQVLFLGRSRDSTGDGIPDSGADYWTAYGFHVRDAVRQTVVDHLQLVRLLRSFDGRRTWPADNDDDGRPDLAGDFNADGVVDFGGPQVEYYAWGQSGGGIHSALLGPVEPVIRATAPTAGGGGLADVGVRTMLGAVRRASMLRTMGPLLVGQPAGADMAVSLVVPLATDDRQLPIDTVSGVREGDLVRVDNLGNGERVQVTVRPGLLFRTSIKADRGDGFTVSFFHPHQDTPYARLERWSRDVFYYDTRDTSGEPTFLAGEQLSFPTEGYGLARCTPELRRMLGLFQMVLEPADPAAWAPHYFLDPLDIRPEGRVVTNILEIACAGDQDVPVNTQATLGRAAGIIPYRPEDAEERLDGLTPNDWLITHWVYEGLARLDRFPGTGAVFDPDDLDEGSDGFAAPEPTPAQRLRLVTPTSTGVSGIRFAYLQPQGMHGVFPVTSEPAFDMFSFIVNQVAWFFASGGTEISDARCLEDGSCSSP